MITGQEYVERLKKMNTKVYAFGERVDSVVDFPLFQPHVNSARLTYDLAYDAKYEDLMTVKSHLTGKTINRFTHIHHSTEDLVKKIKMLRMIAQKTGSCFQRCVGWDALNALFSVTYDMDKKLGTDHHKRFLSYLAYVQEEDIMTAGAMTDVKGDRSQSPSGQDDPDMYVHIVERNEQGIVVRGAKAHMTGIINSQEMIIMPTTAMTEQDADYAVACVIPVDAQGVTHIFGRQTNDSRRFEKGDIDLGNAKYGIVGGEALTILEDVFVPWDRVFMAGEYEFAGPLVEKFASFHRQNYGGCKAGVSDVIIGAATALAHYNGTSKASHIRDKVVEMVHLTETLYCGSIACSSEGSCTSSGSYYVDPMLANTVKQNVTRFIYEICRLSHDIAGGIMATLPSEQDLKNPEIGPYIEKYLKASSAISTEDRIRMLRLLEQMTGGTALLESMHGAGSPQAQRIMLLRQANLPHKQKLAEKLAGIEKE